MRNKHCAGDVFQRNRRRNQSGRPLPDDGRISIGLAARGGARDETHGRRAPAAIAGLANYLPRSVTGDRIMIARWRDYGRVGESGFRARRGLTGATPTCPARGAGTA
ncbi:hypothetical protein NDN01_15270 [Sphingomonas sp. QA11]|uniref:hypothetical protein n=1 Tax=Sphingomonas sp. QA11 TaxID=2950605 RepID=UPI00234B7FCF|nr:hypothetical protein [Sphingomonas sp. QA11]WCM25418.1 hypothetical protein NDN01_15270 [Sphingomonas sp. QA11]